MIVAMRKSNRASSPTTDLHQMDTEPDPSDSDDSTVTPNIYTVRPPQAFLASSNFFPGPDSRFLPRQSLPTTSSTPLLLPLHRNNDLPTTPRNAPVHSPPPRLPYRSSSWAYPPFSHQLITRSCFTCSSSKSDKLRHPFTNPFTAYLLFLYHNSSGSLRALRRACERRGEVV